MCPFMCPSVCPFMCPFCEDDMTRSLNKFLYLRGEYWNYKRNVPQKFRHVEPRARVRVALNTHSLELARAKRDALVVADDNYWKALALEAETKGGVTDATRAVQEHLYKAASSRALAHGFDYKPISQLRDEQALDDILARTEKLAENYTPGSEPPVTETAALLGGVERPKPGAITIAEVFEQYVSEIAFDAQRKKSPSQRKSWEKAKRTSINYFIEAIGNLKIGQIERRHALNYRNWWADRIKNGDENGDRPTPYTANRHIGNMRSLYREFFSYKGQEDRSNPFRRISFKEDRSTKKKRPPFETNWIKDKFLIPGLFESVNEDARHILYTLIETGARPSEICNLRPENIRLDADVPYLAIREADSREIKADASDRDIPLVGVSLAAMKLHPEGFPRYFDKETSLSAILMKALKSRDLLPTNKHKVYSLRHSFEKRMLEAGLEYDLRCTLMGHKNERPDYGDGGSMEFRRVELLKIAFPYSGWPL